MDKKLSIGELSKILHRSKKAVHYQIEAGHLPAPISDGQEMFFDSDEVAQKIGVENFDEPFVTVKRAEEILGMNKKDILRFCSRKINPIPSYKLNLSSIGEQRLFRESELEEWQKITLVKDSSYGNFSRKYNLLLKFFFVTSSIVNFEGKEKDILALYFDNNLNSTEISQKFNISNSMVNQILNEGIKRAMKTILNFPKFLESRQAIVKELMEEKNGNKNSGQNISVYPINEEKLSPHLFNALDRIGIKYLTELTEYSSSDLLKFRNIGKVAVAEISAIMQKYNLKLADD